MTYIPLPEPADVPAAKPAPEVTEVLRTARVQVLDYHCRVDHAQPVYQQYSRLTIVAVRRGAFCYGEHGFTHVVEPGTLVLGCPGDEYHCAHDYGGGDVSTVFQFEDGIVDELRAAHRLPALLRSAVFAQAPVLHAQALVAEGGLAAEEAAYRLVATALGALSGGLEEVPPSLRRADRDRAHAAAQWIEAHFSESLSLEAIADHVATSPYHFLRLFRRELGLTPHQYLIRTRLRHALRLLGTTRRTVTEVAFDVGFTDLSNFTRTFRRHVGVTPEAFRRHGVA